MAFRLRWQVNVEWIPPGVGPMAGAAQGVGFGAPGVGMAPTGVGPSLALFQGTTPVSAGTGGPPPTSFGAGTFTISAQTGDAGILTGAAATDLYAQLTNAANVARLTGFITGQP
jgi:hypothetical protein